MNGLRAGFAAAAFCAALFGVGCTTVPPEPTAAAHPQGARWLEQGVALFEQGRFAEALRLLQESPEIAAAGPEVRAQALKYVAFSQCLTERLSACRRTFEALLVLDPEFRLHGPEAGHPIWGLEYAYALAASARAAEAALRR